MLKEACRLFDVRYYIPKGKEDRHTIFLFAKIAMWSVFDKAYVLTYRSKYSSLKMLCDLTDIDIRYYHIESDEFVEGYEERYPQGLDRLDMFKGTEKYNFPDTNTSHGLSKGWYEKNTKGTGTEELKKLLNTLRCFCRDIDSYYWTTFSSFRDKVKPKDVKRTCPNDKGKIAYLVACNLKATNEFRDRTHVAYLCNRYMNPILVQLLKSCGVQVKEDQWALSELLQFVWRSNIRNHDSIKKISLFIPSERMRGLFEEWLSKGLELAVAA